MNRLLLTLLALFFSLAVPHSTVLAAANPINPVAPPASAAPGAMLADYTQAIKNLQNNRFGENDIKGFVFQLFAMFDRHADFGQLSVMFSEDDLLMNVPGAKIISMVELANWYAKVGATYQSNIHYVDNVTVSFLSKGNYKVTLTVLWQALGRDGKLVSQKSKQEWTMVDGGGYWPRITQYLAEPVP